MVASPASAAERSIDWRPVKPYREVWQTTIKTADALVIIRAGSSHEGLCMRQHVIAAFEENGLVVLEEQGVPDESNPKEIL